VFRLSGSGTPWLLNKLCGLDMQHGWVAGTHCARTRLQHAGVVLHQHSPGGPGGDKVLDLILDRSLALYAWRLLLASIPHADQLTQMHGAP
jgi:sarcosine oxidase gamma subunit